MEHILLNRNFEVWGICVLHKTNFTHLQKNRRDDPMSTSRIWLFAFSPIQCIYILVGIRIYSFFKTYCPHCYSDFLRTFSAQLCSPSTPPAPPSPFSPAWYSTQIVDIIYNGNGNGKNSTHRLIDNLQ